MRKVTLYLRGCWLVAQAFGVLFLTICAVPLMLVDPMTAHRLQSIRDRILRDGRDLDADLERTR